MMLKPKLSIVCITYNQESYITQCLESFLSQKTNFEFEIIVSDDLSTDKTGYIISRFASRHRGKIRQLDNKKNLGVAGNFWRGLRAAKGDYIALCEGDDYWTDNDKLQKQVDFMETHTDYSVCFHPVRMVNEDTGEETHYPKKRTDFSIESLLKENYIQTNSVVYRRQDYTEMPDNILPVDWYLHLFHARFGKIGFIDKAMGVYRRHPGGLWWDAHKNLDAIWHKHGLAHLKLYIEMLKLFADNKTYQAIICESMRLMFVNLIQADEKYKDGQFAQAVKLYPKAAEDFAIYIHNRVVKRELEIEDLKQLRLKDHEAFSAKLNEKDQIIRQREEQLENIHHSKIWKLRNLLAKILGRPRI